MRRILLGLESVDYFEMDWSGQVTATNQSFARRMGTTPGAMVGERVVRFFTDGDALRIQEWLDGEVLPDDSVLLNFSTPTGEVYTHRCFMTETGGGLALAGEADVCNERLHAGQLLQLNNEMAVISRERGRQSRELATSKQKLADTLEEIRTTHWHLRRIQEHLPVCMECGRVKVDTTRWASLVDYLKENEILVTHGCCSDCARKLEAMWGLDLPPANSP